MASIMEVECIRLRSTEFCKSMPPKDLSKPVTESDFFFFFFRNTLSSVFSLDKSRLLLLTMGKSSRKFMSQSRRKQEPKLSGSSVPASGPPHMAVRQPEEPILTVTSSKGSSVLVAQQILTSSCANSHHRHTKEGISPSHKVSL